jgi:gas vesicle protein
MSGFNLFNGTTLDNILWQAFKVLPTVYEESLSYMEMVEKALYHLNQDRDMINTMGQAIQQFEEYVMQELADTDEKIQNEVTTLLNGFVTDGTIENLINQTIFGQINSDITTLKNEAENFTNSIQDINNTLSYAAPSLTIAGNPSPEILDRGETIPSIIISVNLTKNTLPITHIDYYKNDVIIHSKDLTGNETQDFFIDSNVNTTSLYYTTISDGKKTIKSESVKYDFIYRIYSGVVADGTTINEANIKSLSGALQYKGSFTKRFTTNNQKVILAYPSAYGDLTNIIDENDMEVLDSFTKSTLNMTMEDNTSQPYTVYITNDTNFLDNYALNFIFDEDTSVINQNVTIDFSNIDFINGGTF